MDAWSEEARRAILATPAAGFARLAEVSATGHTPAELRPKVAEPKVSATSLGGPADAMRKAKPAEPAKQRQEQPAVKPQEDGFSFMRRLKEMRDKILVKVGLKEQESQRPSLKASAPATATPASMSHGSAETPRGRLRSMVPTAEDLKLMKAKERIDAAFAKQGGNEKRLDQPEAPGFRKEREAPKPKHEMPPPSVGGFRR